MSRSRWPGLGCSATLIPHAALQIGYITSEIWREGQTSFSLDHRMADMHDVNGSTLYACPCSPNTSALGFTPRARVFRYISSMVVHPSQRGKRLGELFVTRLIKQVALLPLHCRSASSRVGQLRDHCGRSPRSTLLCVVCCSSSIPAGWRRRRYTCGSGGRARRLRFDMLLMLGRVMFYQHQHC